MPAWPIPEYASPLDAFLAHASLEAGDNQASAGQDALQLMTVHSAKGLEFDAVFIGGLEEGLFPHDNSTADLRPGLEEERRLMYVAITRARKRLYLSFSQTRMLHGQTRYNPKLALLRRVAARGPEVADAAGGDPADRLRFRGEPRWRRRRQHLRPLQRRVGGRRAARVADRTPRRRGRTTAGAGTARCASASGRTSCMPSSAKGVIVNLEGGGSTMRARRSTSAGRE